MSDSVRVPAGSVKGQTAVATLDALVSKFCVAVGEPIPVDALAEVYRLRAEVEELRERMADAYGCLVRMKPDERGMRNQVSGEPTRSGADLIAAERQRQVSVEGWTLAHDDTHTHRELSSAAAAYALYGGFGPLSNHAVSLVWPWEVESFKPSRDRIRDLVKAGALIAAEIDRLHRLDSFKSGSPGSTEPLSPEGSADPGEVAYEACPDCGEPGAGLCGPCDSDRVSAEIADEYRRSEATTLDGRGEPVKEARDGE